MVLFLTGKCMILYHFWVSQRQILSPGFGYMWFSWEKIPERQKIERSQQSTNEVAMAVGSWRTIPLATL